MARDGSRFAGLPFGHGSVCEQDLNARLSRGFASVAAGFRPASASIVASAFSNPTPRPLRRRRRPGSRLPGASDRRGPTSTRSTPGSKPTRKRNGNDATRAAPQPETVLLTEDFKRARDQVAISSFAAALGGSKQSRLTAAGSNPARRRSDARTADPSSLEPSLAVFPFNGSSCPTPAIRFGRRERLSSVESSPSPSEPRSCAESRSVADAPCPDRKACRLCVRRSSLNFTSGRDRTVAPSRR
jgi:hypothetical protein